MSFEIAGMHLLLALMAITQVVTLVWCRKLQRQVQYIGDECDALNEHVFDDDGVLGAFIREEVGEALGEHEEQYVHFVDEAEEAETLQ